MARILTGNRNVTSAASHSAAGNLRARLMHRQLEILESEISDVVLHYDGSIAHRARLARLRAQLSTLALTIDADLACEHSKLAELCRVIAQAESKIAGSPRDQAF